MLVWYAGSDADSDTRALAEATFVRMAQPLPDDIATPLFPLLRHVLPQVRTQAARALALGMDEQPDELGPVLISLSALYKSHLPAKPVSSDDLKPKFVVRDTEQVSKPKQVCKIHCFVLRAWWGTNT